MKVRWRDFEFEVSDKKDLDLVVEFVKGVMELKKAEDRRETICKRISEKSWVIKRNTPEYQGKLASKILLEKAIPKMEKDKWYMGKEIFELAGLNRRLGYLYYGLTKLVEEGVLEEKRDGKYRFFKLKSEEDFDFKKMFLEEKKVMDGILR